MPTDIAKEMLDDALDALEGHRFHCARASAKVVLRNAVCDRLKSRAKQIIRQCAEACEATY